MFLYRVFGSSRSRLRAPGAEAQVLPLFRPRRKPNPQHRRRGLTAASLKTPSSTPLRTSGPPRPAKQRDRVLALRSFTRQSRSKAAPQLTSSPRPISCRWTTSRKSDTRRPRVSLLGNTFALIGTQGCPRHFAIRSPRALILPLAPSATASSRPADPKSVPVGLSSPEVFDKPRRVGRGLKLKIAATDNVRSALAFARRAIQEARQWPIRPTPTASPRSSSSIRSSRPTRTSPPSHLACGHNRVHAEPPREAFLADQKTPPISAKIF